ncbi:MAG TPA: hypothetical protein VFG51_01740, partial [Candidatus Saccharimonadia bacterium]|nr:hypothetical protein [Candidatus Saccharimonadia bacterium]
VPSHLEIIENNRHLKQFSIFELANVYLPREKDLPEESLRLTLTSTQEFRVVKGHVEALLHKLHIPENAIAFEQNGDAHANILVDGKKVGSLFIEHNVTIAGFIWKALLHVARKNPMYKPVSQFTPLLEEFTFTLPAKTKIAEVLKTVTLASGAVLPVTLKSIYNSNVTIAVPFSRMDRQLTTEDVAPFRKQVVEQVEQKHHATFVGKL